MKQLGSLNTVGHDTATILVIADAPGRHTYDTGQVLSSPQMKLLQRLAKEGGIPGNEFRLVTPSPPIPEEIQTSERKIGDYLAGYRNELLDEIGKMPNLQLIVPLGKVALRQLQGKQVKITEARGSLCTCDAAPNVPVLPMLSLAHVLRRPEMLPIFEGDFRQIPSLRDADWNTGIFASSTDSATYEWCLDLAPLIKKRPSVLALDTETKGLDWRNGRKAIICVQITVEQGKALVIPLCKEYFNNPELRGKSSKGMKQITDADVLKLSTQLSVLLGDPKTRVAGHNLKFDLHHLRNYGIEVGNWAIDTMQLAFAADDNMQTKSLDECVRRWVPEMAAYADAFNSETDKSQMELVPHDKMLRYAGGDTDACFRLATKLAAEVRKDSRQWATFEHVQMPGLQAFFEVEEAGIKIDRDALRELGESYTIKEQAAYKNLLEMAAKKAPAVLRRHQDAGLAFSRAAFVSDLLFSEDGYGLTPKVWTASTRKLPMEKRIPSVSSKDHLPFFEHIPFVKSLMEYQKLSKMRNTYIGAEGGVKYKPIEKLKNGKFPKPVTEAFNKAQISPVAAPLVKATGPVRRRSILTPSTAPKIIKPHEPVQWAGNYLLDANGRVFRGDMEEPTGFWQYLQEGLGGDRIHPSFRLDNTVTGRTSSQNPNAQNFPKRGPIAKDFRKIFIPEPGWVFIEADLSQAELRIAAWMANEKNMLRVYQQGGDIHAATAAGVLGIPLDKVTKEDRQKAKAINFGFLYGMWWTKFMAYAKTDYGVTFTPKQAEAIRNRFFDMYPGLAAWHKEMACFVKEHGYVRAMHGALRRLPSILSDDEIVRRDTERQATNSPVQRLASDLGVMAMARFSKYCPADAMRPVAFIHDAVIVEAREDRAIEAAGALKYCMQNIPLEELFGVTPPVPIVSDVSIGLSLAGMEERPEIAALAPIWLG